LRRGLIDSLAARSITLSDRATTATGLAAPSVRPAARSDPNPL